MAKKTLLLLANSAELILLIILAADFLVLCASHSTGDGLVLRPTPDAAEYAYVAVALSEGHSPLLPIGHELLPSRYCPLHPLALMGAVLCSGSVADGFRLWPPFAIIAGTVILILTLHRMGVSPVGRVAALLLLFFSPLSIAIATSLLQESTMYLLFALAVYSWQWSVSRPETIQDRQTSAGRHSVLLLFLSGLLFGMVTCMRVTVAPVILIAALHVLLVSGWRATVALLAGSALAATGMMTYSSTLAGYLCFQGYGHWMPEGIPFSFRHIFRLEAGLPLWKGLLNDFFGATDKITMAGTPCMILLFPGALSVYLGIRGTRLRRLIPDHSKAHLSAGALLLLFAMAQLLTHLFYSFYAIRFFALAYPAVIIGGVAIIDVLCRKSLWIPFRRIPHHEAGLLLSGLLLLPGPILTFQHLHKTETEIASKRRLSVQRECQTHEANRSALQASKQPLFVDSLGVLNARVLLGLTGSPEPIAHITRHPELWHDGHMLQFVWYRVRPAVGYLVPADIWPGRPSDCFLYDPASRTVNEEFIHKMLTARDQFALYFPVTRKPFLKPLLDWLKAHSFEIRNLSRDPSWDLLVVHKTP